MGKKRRARQASASGVAQGPSRPTNPHEALALGALSGPTSDPREALQATPQGAVESPTPLLDAFSVTEQGPGQSGIGAWSVIRRAISGDPSAVRQAREMNPDLVDAGLQFGATVEANSVAQQLVAEGITGLLSFLETQYGNALHVVPETSDTSEDSQAPS